MTPFNLVDGEDGWIGLGPGTDMSNAKVVIGGPNLVESYTLKQYDLVAPTNELGATDIENIVTNGKRIVCYKLPENKLHGSISDASFVASMGRGDVKPGNQHNFRKQGLMLSGVTGVAVPTLVKLHVVFMIASFWLLYPLGALAAVYAGPHFKAGAKFFNIHQYSMILAILLMLAGFVCVLVKTESVTQVHGYFGVFVFILCFMQPLNAVVRPDKDHAMRRRWEYLHKGAGRLALLWGLINTILGGILYQDLYADSALFLWNPHVAAYVLAPIFVVAYIALRIRQQLTKKEPDYKEQPMAPIGKKRSSSRSLDMEAAAPLQTVE